MCSPRAIMKQKLIPLLGIAFVVALIATGIFYGLFVSKLQSSNPRYSLVTAAKDLPRGTVLQASDLKVGTLEAPEPPRGAYTSPEQVLGLTVLETIAAGGPVVDSRLASHRSVPVGMRAISVHVVDSSGVVSMLQPGYKIDVQVVAPNARNEASLRTILQNVEVLSASPAENNRPVVNLIVAPEDADVLGLADSTARLRITLRNSSDQNRPPLGILPSGSMLQHSQAPTGTPQPIAGNTAERMQKVAVPR